MKKSHVLIAAVAVATSLVLSSYASPYWTLHRMNTAIAEKDADRFSSYIDFPALRDSVKGQMMVMMNERLSRPEMADNPFAGIGQMMGAALINPIVDAAVSPAGVIAMFESGKAQPLPGAAGKQESPAPGDARADAPDAPDAPNYAVDYESWSRVAISKPGGDAGRFILKRTGLWSWQLAALELPDSVPAAAD
ncbi:MAG: hypothetical protein JWP72_1359 [Massilia sp.]|nr:hypothetical protein [Massilia sp.]MDB5790250.1 hypothetical protein [Massilia sp.]